MLGYLGHNSTYPDGAFGGGLPVAVVLVVAGCNDVGAAADADVGAAAVGDDQAVGEGRRRLNVSGQPREWCDW